MSICLFYVGLCQDTKKGYNLPSNLPVVLIRCPGADVRGRERELKGPEESHKFRCVLRWMFLKFLFGSPSTPRDNRASKKCRFPGRTVEGLSVLWNSQ